MSETVDARATYAEAIRLLEAGLADAGRAQFAGQRPDLLQPRRALIELRRGVPNDRTEPVNQVVRDLLTAYASVFDAVSSHDRYSRQLDLPPEVVAELERLAPRARRQGLAVLDPVSGDVKRSAPPRTAPAGPGDAGRQRGRAAGTRPAPAAPDTPAPPGPGRRRRGRAGGTPRG